MKKLIAILLVICLCAGLVACRSAKKVQNDLAKKSWSYSETDESWGDYTWSATSEVKEYSFSVSGTVGYYYRVTFYTSGYSSDLAKDKKNGTYTIKGDEIIISYSDGKDTILNYEYSGGELKLYQENYDGTITYFT